MGIFSDATEKRYGLDIGSSYDVDVNRKAWERAKRDYKLTNKAYKKAEAKRKKKERK